jgi:hypothetical protein
MLDRLGHPPDPQRDALSTAFRLSAARHRIASSSSPRLEHAAEGALNE